MENLFKTKNTFGIDLEQTFECGQCFRFNRVVESKYDVEYCGVAYGHKVSFAEKDGFIYVSGADEAEFEQIWRHFLSLDMDYDAVHRNILSLSNNDFLVRAVNYGKGIRILRQEPWETICSFIISQNNNIPRIKGLIKALAETAGERIDEDAYSFPNAEAVLKLGTDGLRKLKMGFRAPYIIDAAEKVVSGKLDIDEVASLTTPEAEMLLRTVKGIGPKVASCVLLFGFSKYDAFPIDVWIKRVLKKYFEPFSAPPLWGKYAGVAQQVLFYYERQNSKNSQK